MLAFVDFLQVLKAVGFADLVLFGEAAGDSAQAVFLVEEAGHYRGAFDVAL